MLRTDHRRARRAVPAFAIVTAAMMLSGSPAARAEPRSVPHTANSFYAPAFSSTPSVDDLTQLGRLLFFDRALSASGGIACATCHDPRLAYGPASTTHLRAPHVGEGLRAIPSLRYLQLVPPFAEHRFDESVDESVDQGPSGGHAWDGRADTLHDQARLPLLSPLEMANRSPQDVVAKVRHASYSLQFRKTFGDDVFDDVERAFNAVLLALEVFQQSPREFYPYSSRYDEWLRGRGTLSRQELRGLELFDDPRKGNCASCHPSRMRHGAMPQFTDYGYAALAVPRNAHVAANTDPRFHDLGLCGPQRSDLVGRSEYCGMFRVPTLRNVALRHVFFHNGTFGDLKRAVLFYAQRDTNPARWYRTSRHGSPALFDDLPREYHANVNREPPFGRNRGDPPPLTDDEVTDIVAFLRTLTDADVQSASQSKAK